MEEKLNELSFVQALIFGVLFGGGYYYFFYLGSNTAAIYENAQNQIQEAQIEIVRLDRDLKLMQDLKIDIENNYVEIEKALEYLPTELNSQLVSQYLSTEARTSGLDIISILARDSWEQEGIFDSLNVSVQLKGSFFQIMSFFSNLTRKKHIYNVMESEIVSSGQSSETLSLSTRITVYKLNLGALKDLQRKSGVSTSFEGEGAGENI